MGERDWKEYAEQRMGHEGRDWGHAILETECPSCGRRVGALIRDDDDRWKNVVCPRDVCGHVWTEEVAA